MGKPRTVLEPFNQILSFKNRRNLKPNGKTYRQTNILNWVGNGYYFKTCPLLKTEGPVATVAPTPISTLDMMMDPNHSGSKQSEQVTMRVQTNQNIN